MSSFLASSTSTSTSSSSRFNTTSTAAPRQRKIVLMGSRAVGKSSLAVQFCEGQFVESYYPTIEDSLSRKFAYKKQEYQLDLQDTAGHDEFSLLNNKYAMGWHGYILVYSIASRQSFEMIPIILDKILSYSLIEKVPMCIVGNKTDLGEQRVVSIEHGQALARKLGCAFTEASAKKSNNVDQAFMLLFDEIEKERGLPEHEGANGNSSGRDKESQSWGAWFKSAFGTVKA